MTKNAQIALQAAKLRKTCGRYAAMQWAIKRGCPLSLYRLACQLQAAS